MNVISIIPARKNSQSIRNKNLAKLGNKPLIYYSIKQYKYQIMVYKLYKKKVNIKI